MTTDRFGLSDVRFYGYHGAAEHERQVGQWFSADIELHCDLSRAGACDDLAATVDYRDAARLVVEVGSGEPAQLLERVADRIVQACLRTFAIEAARVRLRKFSSPAPGVPGTTWVEIFRTRSAATREDHPENGAATPRRRSGTGDEQKHSPHDEPRPGEPAT